MDKIKVIIDWCEKNFCGTWEDPNGGLVICTHKTLDGVKAAFIESLDFHLNESAEQEEKKSEQPQKRAYEIEWYMETAAILRDCERYTTLSAISHACGINQRQLSHYANGVKKARNEQRERIIQGIHSIGQHFITVC